MATAPVTDFGTFYVDEAQDTSSGLSGVPVGDSVSLDDPSLLLSELETNSDVDPYAAPPPIPDGRYRVKVKQIDVKRTDGTTARFATRFDPQKNNGIAYAWTALELTVVDPTGKLDGVKLYDRFVSTMQQRNGGIPIVRILTVLGHKLPAKVNAKSLLDEFFKATAGEPELEVDTVWEGGLDEADREAFTIAAVKQPRLLGMHRFPKNDKGEFVPEKEVDTPLGKKVLTARPRVNGYFALGSGKK